MKILTTTMDVEKSGVTGESHFSIKATSKAFDILSSALYSDKILAIVRELSCNAYDSHVAAGKKDEPIQITLPTQFNRVFTVKDNGVGLSDIQVRGGWKHDDGAVLSIEEGDAENLIDGVDGWHREGGIYNTYFESTKTTSDDFIGQLGLGSKSPFSYTSSFTVEARHGGVRRMYTCYKDERNMPAIAVMGSEPTDESNGVTVSIAVRQDDVERFRTAAKKALMFFAPVPQFSDPSFTPYAVSTSIRGTNWAIRNAEYDARMHGAYVIQGFVAYPILLSALEEHGIDPMSHTLLRSNINLYIDIGSVEVAASREALSYDKRTINNLIATAKGVVAELRTTIQREFDNQTTKWEAIFLMHTYNATPVFEGIFSKMHREEPFTWNGKEVDATVKVDMTNIKHTRVEAYSLSRSKKSSKIQLEGASTPVDMVLEKDLNISSKAQVLVDTNGKHTRVTAYKAYLETRPNISGSVSLYVIRPHNGTYNQQEVDQLLEMFGHPPLVDVSKVVAPVRRSTYKPVQKRQQEEKLVFTGFSYSEGRFGRREVRRTFSRLTWKAETISVTDGGLYVVLDRFTPVPEGDVRIDVSMLDVIIDHAKQIGLVADDVRVIGVNTKELAALKKSGGKWVELFTHIRQEFNKANTDNVLFSNVTINAVFNAISHRVKTELVERWDQYKDAVEEGDFKNLINDLQALTNQQRQQDNTKAITELCSMVDIKLVTDDRVMELPTRWRAIIGQYEMLSFISYDTLNHAWIGMMIRYVNMCEQSKRS